MFIHFRFKIENRLLTDKNNFCYDLLYSSFPYSGFFEYFHDEFLKYIRQEPLPNKWIREKNRDEKKAGNSKKKRDVIIVIGLLRTL